MAVAIGLIAYGQHRKQLEWDAAVAVQAVEAAENLIKNAQNTAKIEVELTKMKQKLASKVKVVTKEVRVYVEGQSSKCIITPEFERVFDSISRMHSASEDSMPPTSGPSGAAVVASDAPITDAAVLSAYQGAVVELYSLWDSHTQLVNWVVSSHKIAMEGAGRDFK